MSKAALKFNFKPKNGVNYLVAQKLITGPDDYEQHVRDVVKFLKGTPALDKTMIGEFLGKDDKFSKDCLY
jgi:Sec7-like guanine-nucleotide exchange factor